MADFYFVTMLVKGIVGSGRRKLGVEWLDFVQYAFRMPIARVNCRQTSRLRGLERAGP